MTPRVIPVLYLVSKEKINKIPSNTMKLYINSFKEKFRFNMIGSKMAVKKPTSEKQTTPIEILEALILPKKNTQCKPNKAPVTAIGINDFIGIFCIFFVANRNKRNIIEANNILHHTIITSFNVISLPNILPSPANKIAMCSFINISFIFVGFILLHHFRNMMYQ